MNASPSNQPETHWLLFAQAAGQIFFADPLSKRVYDYPLVYKNMRRTIHDGNQLLIKKPVQSVDSVFCGLYYFSVAHVIVTNKFPVGNLMIMT